MGVHMATWVWFTFVLLLLGGTSGPSSWTHHHHHPYPYQYACHAQQQEERRHIVQKPLLDPVPVLPQVTHKVYLDIELSSSSTTTDHGSETNDKSPIVINSGRIVLGLFGTNAPQLVENFITFCDCTHPSQDPTLCYRGSIFHRVIPNFMIQGGDTTHFDGTGGTTIYAYDAANGGALEHTITTDQFLPRGDIPDENLSSIPLNRKYLLASANRGYRNSNTSQFFITTVKTQWLNGHHVVFGVVLDGEDVIRLIEAQGTNGGIPKQRITIVQTGSLELTTQDQIPIPVARREAFPKYKRLITTVPPTQETVEDTK